MVPVHLSRRSKPAKIRVRTARAGTALYPTRPFPEFSSRLSPPPESESFSLRASASHRSHANRKQGSGGFELPASKSWNARRGRERRAEFQAGLPAGRPPACGFGKRPPDLQKPHALRCRQRRFPPAPGLRPQKLRPPWLRFRPRESTASAVWKGNFHLLRAGAGLPILEGGFPTRGKELPEIGAPDRGKGKSNRKERAAGTSVTERAPPILKENFRSNVQTKSFGQETLQTREIRTRTTRAPTALKPPKILP